MARRIFTAVLCTLGAAGIALAATGRDRHEAIYPAQRIPIEFSHALHVKPEAAGGVGAPCEACHEAARKSEKAADKLVPLAGKPRAGTFPEHEACESCHDIAGAEKGEKVDPAASCDTCHLGVDKKAKKVTATAVWPTPNLIFNHKIHFEKEKGIACERCHFGATGKGMEEVDLSTRYQLPKMKTCLECHNGSSAPADCRTCHVTDPSGRLQIAFATATLRPMQGDPLGLDHGPRFELTHGTRAKLDRRACADCHTDSYCATCHDSLQKPISVHPNDYITLHPTQARMDSLQCDSCHRYQSFCAACHERVGIGMSADPTLRARNLQVHSEAFKNGRGSPEHHGIAASRNINQCIACHREESCTKCHASTTVPGSQIVNPHPNGFGSRCRALRQANDRGCAKCHTTADLDMKTASGVCR
ncbi:MAG: cytochrome C [Myxococcaceae bacterium]|nr:cytochrome C [Myxococcaceae bacterium]